MGNKHSAKDKSAADGVKPTDNTFDVYAFPFENVVFEGGSNNLLAFVGAIRVSRTCTIISLQYVSAQILNTLIVEKSVRIKESTQPDKIIDPVIQ